MQESKRVQLQLEDKNAEFEQLALVLHRTRGDLSRKLEKQQKEYEDKIAFLIQQLRGAEMKIHESSSLLRKSFDVNDSGILGSAQHRNEASMYLRPQTANAVGHRDMGLVASFGANSDSNKTGGDGLTKSHYLHFNSITANEVAEDALRKWESEKQRRELLEKRNSELMRELRMYRERERK